MKRNEKNSVLETETNESESVDFRATFQVRLLKTDRSAKFWRMYCI